MNKLSYWDQLVKRDYRRYWTLSPRLAGLRKNNCPFLKISWIFGHIDLLNRQQQTKKSGRSRPDKININDTAKSAAAGSEAIPAQNRAIIARLERHLCFRTALRANSIEHFAGSRRRSAIAATFPNISAVLATDRLVFKAFLRVELLLAGCEYEIFAAVFALECFVLERHYPNPLTLFEIKGPCLADLVFYPTLACWKVCYPAIASHYYFSRTEARQVLSLSRTMLKASLDSLRGSFRLRLASTFNHGPKQKVLYATIIISSSR